MTQGMTGRMTRAGDADLASLARLAGVSTRWTDAFGAPQIVSDDSVRHVLTAIGIPCATPADVAASLAAFKVPQALAPLITVDAGGDVLLPPLVQPLPEHVELEQSGTERRVPLIASRGGAHFTAPREPGFYRLHLGAQETDLAVAPARGMSVRDLTGKARAFGSAVQVYSLCRPGDGGIGDFGALIEASRRLAEAGADALAISPTHALFAAEPARASPYSPSSRLMLNALLADPACLFSPEEIAAAWDEADPQTQRVPFEQAPLIEWAQASDVKLAMLRALFTRLTHSPERSAALAAFRAAGGGDLEGHAVFEAIHGHFYRAEGLWSWRDWPVELRRPESPAVAQFAADHAEEVAFHAFLQWIAAESLDAAQAAARHAGMGIGLIADLAVGMDPAGSHAWSRPDDLLCGLSVGAPPDLLSRDGQDWGLTTFSPTALKTTGFAPFLSTVRAATRHAGGLRIDHILGLRRLWLVPAGAPATDGAYLDYPLDDVLRLIALQSVADRALIIGEDLGTVPDGFRELLSARGILGMRVLPFERDEAGDFLPPGAWDAEAVAMTSTHDLQPIAGWWRGRDLEWRARIKPELEASLPAARAERAEERALFWSAARTEKLALGDEPPESAPDKAVDAAVAYVAAAPCALAIVPVEDLIGAEEAPNLPGTIDEHPNWRRRISLAEGSASAQALKARLAILRESASKS